MRKLFKNRVEWREWLEKNHSTEKEIWLVYYKKHTGKKSISYDGAVEVALCFGWIDSVVKRVDDEKYMQRYTPRRLNSVWSLSNKIRVKKMIKSDEMTSAGLRLVESAKKSGKWREAYSSKNDFIISQDLISELEKNKFALSFFNGLAKGYKYSYARWVELSKTKETRARRIRIVVERCANKKKPGV